MTVSISIAELRSAAEHRPPGYLDHVLSSGRVQNGILLLDEVVYRALSQKYSGTTFIQKARNLSRAGERLVKAAVKQEKILVSPEERDRRLAICQGCEFFNGKTCQKCGCLLNLKTRLETEHCPIGKW